MITLYCDEPYLDLSHHIKAFRELIDSGLVAFRWNRNGCIRTVPAAAVVQAIALYDDYAKMVAVGKLPEMPVDAARISWDVVSLRA